MTEITTASTGLKGVAVRAGLRWVATTYGVETVKAVHEQGSEALRAIIVPGLPTFGILSSGWYDQLVIGELLDLILRVTKPPSVPEHFRQMAIAVAQDNVHGAFRSLFRLITTRSLLVAHAQRVWANYFSAGTLVATSPREGEIVLSARDAPTHHDATCLMTSAVIERILLEVGYKGATLERKQCRGHGGSECVFEVDYVI